MDRSALRFDGEKPGTPQFTHPIFDITYADKPTMISETTHERPNRYRGEAPWIYAAYGSLQDVDAIVHFAFDSDQWEVKPGFWMQQWTLTTPTMVGQFPAAALVYRRTMIDHGNVVVDANLKLEDLMNLKGTPLPEGTSLDELRLKDVPAGTPLTAETPIDPLVHLVGQTRVRFSESGGPPKLQNVSDLIERKPGRVTASSGQLTWKWQNDVLEIAGDQAQGAVGDLTSKVQLPDVTITGSSLSEIVLVSLDDKPLATSGKILLQAMTEEKATGFATDKDTGVRKITSIGKDPWLVRDIAGTVTLKRPDAAKLKLTPLDFNGYRKTSRPVGEKIELDRDVVYYLIER
jgi:hypothetical protein